MGGWRDPAERERERERERKRERELTDKDKTVVIAVGRRVGEGGRGYGGINGDGKNAIKNNVALAGTAQ